MLSGGEQAVALLLGLPRSGKDVAVRVEVEAEGDVQIWRRSFDGRTLETRQWVESGHLIEGKGMGRISMRLTTEGGTLRYRTVRAWLGPFRTPWYPAVDATVSEAEGGWQVCVELRCFPFGTVCRYSGILGLV